MAIDLQRIQAVCFDVDGTLSDTDDEYVEKLARLLKPFGKLLGLPVSLAARRVVMALEAPANALIGVPDRLGLDDEIFKLADWLARHSHAKTKAHRAVPGVEKMLTDLARQMPLAVVSARDERTTRRFLEGSGLDGFFTCVVVAQTCAHTKPFPDPIFWAVERMGVPPQTCLMVGDTSIDMRAGKAAGTQTLGVLCGFGERRELLRDGADLILESTAQVADLLLGVGG